MKWGWKCVSFKWVGRFTEGGEEKKSKGKERTQQLIMKCIILFFKLIDDTSVVNFIKACIFACTNLHDTVDMVNCR